MIDWLWRIGYRGGYLAARMVWCVRRPSHVGAVLAAWLDDNILIVRQSYRHVPYWPGGGVAAGEDPEQAILRELKEELGLELQSKDLFHERTMSLTWESRAETVSVYETYFEKSPQLRVDNREIVAAEFVDPHSLLKLSKLPPYMRAYLTERLKGL